MRIPPFSFTEQINVISLPWWSLKTPLQIETASLLRREMQIKCLNQVRFESLNFWRGAERKERRKWSCIFVHLGTVRVGWRWSEQKSSQNCTRIPWPPGPQLPHFHKPCLMAAGTLGGWALSHPMNRNKQMRFVHAALLQTPYLVVGRLNVLLTLSSSTTKVVYLMF